MSRACEVSDLKEKAFGAERISSLRGLFLGINVGVRVVVGEIEGKVTSILIGVNKM